jgi:dolichyl-diphosphooligosaccharide--protein glycosyltransferase
LLYPAYTAFFVVGTLGALQVPVVGTAPLRSLEQMLPLGVFAAMQLFGA